MEKLVSLIVLSYKNISGVYETVDSILNQDYGNIEIIISDDGSPDFEDNKNKIKAYIEDNKKDNIKSIVINDIKINAGTVKNINSAIRLSKGDLIKVLSAEDKLSNKYSLTKYVEFMNNHNYLIAFAKMQGVTEEGEIKSELLSCESNYELLSKYSIEETRNRLFSRNFLPAPAWIIDKKLFEQQGLFKEDTRLIEDYPYWIYLCQKGVTFGYIDEILVDYKLSGVSSGGFYSEMFMNDMFIIYNKYIFPYDRRYGFVQPIYNKLKKAGLNYYINEAKRSKMGNVKKVITRIGYLPFHVFVKLQKVKVNKKQS